MAVAPAETGFILQTCWQHSETDRGQRPIEPREPQIRGTLEYHLVRENGTTAIYEPMLTGSGRSLPKNEERGEKAEKILLPLGGGETAVVNPKLSIYGNILE